MRCETAPLQKRESASLEPETTRNGNVYVPLVDILESENDLLLVADVPGATPNDVDVSYERGLLTLHARVAPRDHREGRMLLQEYGVGNFARSFQIGEGIDSENVSADLKDGVLTLRLPKAPAARRRKIAVKSA
jgi:HSP20 family protein